MELENVSHPNSSSQIQTINSHLRGVRGWLLFFCISLTLVVPATHGWIGMIALKNLAKTQTSTPYTLIRLAAVTVIYFGLGLFSFVAGVQLWGGKRAGLVIAKAYLVMAPVVAITLTLILWVVGIKLDLLKIILNRLAYSAIWYAYLVNSQRVKATYESKSESI